MQEKKQSPSRETSTISKSDKSGNLNKSVMDSIFVDRGLDVTSSSVASFTDEFTRFLTNMGKIHTFTKKLVDYCHGTYDNISRCS